MLEAAAVAAGPDGIAQPGSSASDGRLGRNQLRSDAMARETSGFSETCRNFDERGTFFSYEAPGCDGRNGSLWRAGFPTSDPYPARASSGSDPRGGVGGPPGGSDRVGGGEQAVEAAVVEGEVAAAGISLR